LLRQKQKKLIMLPSETMIWQPEFTDKTLSRKPGAVQTSSTSMLIQIVTLVFKRSSKGRVLHSRTQIHLHIMLRLMRNRVIGVSIWSSSKSYPITSYAREKWF
ncbi:hypothetical protein ABOC23_22820, partial [Escherichia coli]